ncbi:hypothetical protein B9Z55_009297 [Caenorhabditis nigoni]|uniref:Uncharacterized protein n=1 Tax=Caenorhabditis nigoni TaxID=1611254 RepID=A0A2G5URD7_9PELO|nr:hypothetical protein B9Z55_009297 [Caenorhabditis nigoni]
MEEKKIRGTKPPCYWFDHSDVIISQVSWALLEASLWSIAMIIDPLTNIILDRNVLKQAKKQVKWIYTKSTEIAQFFVGSFSKRKKDEKEEKEEEEQEQTTQLELITSIIE